jgi:hypothetical protein
MKLFTHAEQNAGVSNIPTISMEKVTIDARRSTQTPVTELSARRSSLCVARHQVGQLRPPATDKAPDPARYEPDHDQQDHAFNQRRQIRGALQALLKLEDQRCASP